MQVSDERSGPRTHRVHLGGLLSPRPPTRISLDTGVRVTLSRSSQLSRDLRVTTAEESATLRRGRRVHLDDFEIRWVLPGRARGV